MVETGLSLKLIGVGLAMVLIYAVGSALGIAFFSTPTGFLVFSVGWGLATLGALTVAFLLVKEKTRGGK